MPAEVDDRSAAYTAMEPAWLLPDDLLGGTRLMRARGATWLPLEEKEDAAVYSRRLNRSFLFGGYRDGRDRLAGRPFSKAVQVKGLPPVLEPMVNDIDGFGTNITTFTHRFFKEAMHRGVAHIMTELDPNPERREVADPEWKGRKIPYFRTVTAKALIGWKTNPKQAAEVSQTRELYERIVADGEFGEQRLSEIIVWESGKIRTFQKKEGEASFTVNPEIEKTVTLVGVPLSTLNLAPTGFMTASPCLEDLAWVNLAHWQSQSDQRAVLRFARLSLLCLAGVSDEEAKKITMGPSGFIRFSSPEAKAWYAERSAAPIMAGRQDLLDLEEVMAMLGMQPMISQTGAATATGKAIDEANVQSNLRAWVMLLEQTLEQAFRWAAQWMGVEMPAEFSVDVFDDFTLSLRADTEMQSLIAMRKARMISSTTFLQAAKSRGLLPDSLVVEDEAAEVADETPAFPGFGTDGGSAPLPGQPVAGAA